MNLCLYLCRYLCRYLFLYIEPVPVPVLYMFKIEAISPDDP